MAGDLADGLRCGAVEHHRDSGAASGRLFEEVPGNLVCVSGGGGDEEPEVGCREQLRGELAIALLHGVDVWGVEDGDAGRHAVARDELEVALVVRRVIGAGELGQQAVGPEPVGVGGIVHEDRRAGGRTQHPGDRDALADHAVHEGRLAGAGGAPDDREERRVDLDQPRDDVVVELGDQLVALPATLVGARRVEGKHALDQRLPEPHEHAEELGCRTEFTQGAPLLSALVHSRAL